MSFFVPIIFIILWTIFGVVLLVSFLDLKIFRDVKNLLGQKIQINPLIFYISSGYIVGTIVSNWLVYIFAYIFQDFSDPIFLGNTVSFFIIAWVSLSLYLLKRNHFNFILRSIKLYIEKFSVIELFKIKVIFFFLLFIFFIFLMFYTFRIQDNNLIIGLSVFSDFAAHISTIRSFSFGNNLPTIYPMFPDYSGIRYHFMFFFMVANLEKLGLPIDWSLNLPSLLGLLSFSILLYQLSILLLGNVYTALLSVLLFIFRIGMGGVYYLVDIINYFNNFGSIKRDGVFYHLQDNPLVMNNISIDNILSAILNLDFFVGRTVNEDWGLYSINVFLNQRHLAFSLSVMIFLIIVLYPFIFKGFDYFKTFFKQYKNNLKIDLFSTNSSNKLFNKLNFDSKNLGLFLFLGAVLGSIGFWNGSVFVACLMMFFLFFFIINQKLKFMFLIVVSIFLFFLQLRFFVKDLNDINSINLSFGYLVQFSDSVNINEINKYISDFNIFKIFQVLPYAIPDIFKFVFDLTGIFFLFLIFLLFYKKRSLFYKIFIVIFSIPFLAAFFIKLTPDISVNHKYIMISILLLNIFVADFLISLWRRSSKFVFKFFTVIFLLLLSITGIFELIAVINRNTYFRSIRLNFEDSFYVWLVNQTPKESVFLTHLIAIHQVPLSGRKVFFGWPYYAWSAGYNTYERFELVKQIYSAKDEYLLLNLLKINNIDYVLIEDLNRNSEDYLLNEEIFDNLLPLVFFDKSRNLKVFKVV